MTVLYLMVFVYTAIVCWYTLTRKLPAKDELPLVLGCVLGCLVAQWWFAMTLWAIGAFFVYLRMKQESGVD